MHCDRMARLGCLVELLRIISEEPVDLIFVEQERQIVLGRWYSHGCQQDERSVMVVLQVPASAFCWPSLVDCLVLEVAGVVPEQTCWVVEMEFAVVLAS